VDLFLNINGEVLDVSQTGPHSFFLCDPRVLPAGAAELVIQIDGRKKVYPIVLRGSDGRSREVEYW
jgi:hypothetical protein